MKVEGIYIGKVVDNQDPTGGGRVKVFCPNPTLGNYYASLMKNTSISFKFPGNGDFSADFIRQIKPYLQWARVQQPVIGGSASGKFNASTNTASRTNDVQNFKNSVDGTNNNVDGYNLTPMEALMRSNVSDAFAVPSSTMAPNGNARGSVDYKASTYYNAPTGSYNVPRIGSSVMVIFIDGDINKPFVTGAVPDTQASYLNLTDYGTQTGLPGNFENPQ